MTYRNDEDIYEAMIELASGRLAPAEADVVRRHLDADPALAAEYVSVAALVQDLERYGDSLVAPLPEIDVSRAVVERVASLGHGDATVMPFTAPRRRAPRFVPWVAAAAAILLAATWFGARNQTETPAPTVTQHTPDVHENLDVVTPPKVAMYDSGIGMPGTSPDPPAESVGSEAPTEAPSQLARHDVGPEDIIQQRQAAARDDEARQVLARWAALAPERARAILDSPEASHEAIVGAALALGGVDAASVLREAAAADPENPFLSLEAAKAAGTAVQPELDDENALGWYVYARDMLSHDPPNLPEALRALDTAQGYAKAHAYTLEAAPYHEQALIASGLSPDSARLLTAFTSGPSEYEEMVALGNDLLSYAQYFQELGNSDAAQFISESVQRFGAQLDAGALFSHERFAGLELQDTAIRFLETMYGGERSETLARNMEAVAAGFNGLVAFVGNLNAFLTQDLPNDVWRFVADVILQRGDLVVFDNLPSGQ